MDKLTVKQKIWVLVTIIIVLISSAATVYYNYNSESMAIWNRIMLALGSIASCRVALFYTAAKMRYKRYSLLCYIAVCVEMVAIVGYVVSVIILSDIVCFVSAIIHSIGGVFTMSALIMAVITMNAENKQKPTHCDSHQQSLDQHDKEDDNND